MSTNYRQRNNNVPVISEMGEKVTHSKELQKLMAQNMASAYHREEYT
jgi:hypothetical protein